MMIRKIALCMTVLACSVAATDDQLFQPGDYPIRALREGREGTVAFRAGINEAGRVDSCEIIASSGSADLDAVTCQVVTRRARFNPVEDKAGKPVKGTWSGKADWKIPNKD